MNNILEKGSKCFGETEPSDCTFQAKEVDTEGIQAVLVQVPGYLHLLFQEQRGEHRRAHSTDKPQRC